MGPKEIFSLFRNAFWVWYESNPFRLGAALAYYTVFSIAPIVLIAITVANVFFGEEAARQAVVGEINRTVGERVGGAVEATLDFTADTGTGTLATVISIIVLVVGATTVFGQLQDALNTIWGVQAKAGGGVWDVIKLRFLSFGLVLVIGFLLLVSLIASTVLTTLATYMTPAAMPGGVYVGQAVNLMISFTVFTVMFALVFKLLPDVEIAWSDVWTGAAVTALLFIIGKFLISLYLGQSTWIDAYGAAGSLIVILLWVYYSSQILLYGAAFTQVYANRSGKPMVPTENAEATTEEARARQGLSRQTPMDQQAGRDGERSGENQAIRSSSRAMHGEGSRSARSEVGS